MCSQVKQACCELDTRLCQAMHSPALPTPFEHLCVSHMQALPHV